MDVGILPEPLPPQVFTTGAQLLDLTDKKLVIVLRDGRKLIGVLRSYDQYANLVLQDTVERLYSQNLYADVPRGVYIVRGENVLLLGEIDLDKEDDTPLQLASVDEIYDAQKAESAQKKQREKKKARKLHSLGFEAENELIL
ncbi:SM-like, degradation of cytoplasmic mRNAs and positively regulates transcription initiation [Orbilia ellipsospora]|uniref:U6 snRNA-associated Sm-like protein LSm1 n=1 Tax=Orbilia ellipsospora TaxID=2528407 RepID=A0AAV9X658_9PEZI